MVASAQIAKVGPSLPILRDELGLSMFAGGWIASLYPGTAVVIGLLGGALADRFGPHRAMVAALLCIAAGAALGSVAPGYDVLLVSRVVEGVGFVLMVVSGPALTMQAAQPADRELGLGLWTMFMPLGLTAMYILAPLLLGEGWRLVWQVNVGLALVMALCVFAATRGHARNPAAREPERIWRDLKAMVVKPGPWLLSACFGMFAIQFASIMTWMPTFLVEVHGRTVGAAGALTAVLAMIHAPGSFLGGWMMRRRVPRWQVIGCGSAIMGVSAAVTFNTGVPLLIGLIAAAVFSLAAGTLPPSLIAGARVHAPGVGQVGLFNGVLIHGANMGVLVGPPLLGAVNTAFGGWSSGGVYVLALGLAAFPLALAVRAVERRLGG